MIALICVLELLVVVTWPLWWWTLRPKMRARSQIDLWFLATSRTEQLERRVQVLTETRADAVDTAAAELRRLERDLHDGPQARLVALSMSLGLAEQMLAEDPDARPAPDRRRPVDDLGRDRRPALRRTRHPPAGARRPRPGRARSQALALDMAVPVHGRPPTLDGRPPAPVESALYFAVAECLANVGKHAGADAVAITLAARRRPAARVRVADDGVGGADPGAGTGMLGVRRRLAAFDGTMSVSSPTGGPTEVILEVPCDLSSPRTTPSSGPG